MDEGGWVSDPDSDEAEDLIPDNLSNSNSDGLPPIDLWNGKQIVATQCSNKNAVIEWVYVPFIEEDTITSDELATALVSALPCLRH